VGAALSHRNLSYNYQQVHQILSGLVAPEKCGLCPIALQHIVGISFCLMMLSSGAHIVLSRPSELLHKTKYLQKHQFDLMAAIPYLYEQILQQDATRHLVKKMELFMCGGSFASRQLQQQWCDLTGRYLCEAYGLSETAPLISINPPQRIRPGTAGVILPNTEVCVVSNKHKPLGFNQPGELWIRGPQVMRGYWHHPGATQQAMTYDEWFKTGDIVSVSEDGFITMLERQTDTFWWQNQLMFPQEIEQQIRQHEDVMDCVIVQEQDDATAPVRLVVVAKKGLTPERLKEYIASKLHYGFLPCSIEFVDHLPRGPMGKVFRRLLRLRAKDERGSCLVESPLESAHDLSANDLLTDDLAADDSITKHLAADLPLDVKRPDHPN
jgi:long-chain acyl-CoA synthetase